MRRLRAGRSTSTVALYSEPRPRLRIDSCSSFSEAASTVCTGTRTRSNSTLHEQELRLAKVESAGSAPQSRHVEGFFLQLQLNLVHQVGGGVVEFDGLRAL